MIRYSKNENKGGYFSRVLISFMFLYPLFTLTRIKQIASPTVDMMATTNELWIMPAMLLVKKIIFNSHNKKSYKVIVLVWIISLFIIILLGGFRVSNFEQYIFAVVVFLTPMFFLSVFTQKDMLYLNFFIKLFVIVCLTYSILYIILVSSFGNLSVLLGNGISSKSIISSNQYRVRMMIGSTITVANYFVISLPILFFSYFTNKKNFWSKVSLLAIIANMCATILTLSRLAFFASVLVALICIIFQKEKQISKGKSLIIIIIGIVAICYIAREYDITRLFMGFSDSSTLARAESAKLALQIFKLYPIMGSGMGYYFTRVYSDKELVVDGISGLIDPHNAYLLILSELGISGSIIILLLLCYIIRRISKIPYKIFRTTGYSIIIAAGLVSFGGSHLINEISYSIVFWIYISMFYATSFLDSSSLEYYLGIHRNGGQYENINDI